MNRMKFINTLLVTATILVIICGSVSGTENSFLARQSGNAGNSFDWKNRGPLDFLEVLKTHKGTYTVADLHKYWVKASDLPKLIQLIDSQIPCAPVKSVFSSADVEEGVRSFIGLEAIFMIEGYQADQYPPSIISTRSALSKNAIWKSYIKRKSQVLSWYNEECNSDFENYIACNHARAQKYLANLTRKDIGTVLKGIHLTDGKPIFEGVTFVGEAKGIGKGVHLYIVDKPNKQRAAYVWVDEAGMEFPLPTCPESVSHESAYGITWEVYTWKAVQPGHGLVHVMCIEDSWLTKID